MKTECVTGGGGGGYPFYPHYFQNVAYFFVCFFFFFFFWLPFYFHDLNFGFIIFSAFKDIKYIGFKQKLINKNLQKLSGS